MAFFKSRCWFQFICCVLASKDSGLVCSYTHTLPNDLLYFLNLQKQEKYTHGDGKSVYPLLKALVIWLVEEASTRKLPENRVHCQLNKVIFYETYCLKEIEKSSHHFKLTMKVECSQLAQSLTAQI